MAKVIVFIVIIVGGILLQMFLSKKQNKWFGLILPIICLTFSLITVLSVPAFFIQGELTLQQMSPDGTVIEETKIEQQNKSIENIGAAVFQAIVVFLLSNIPTAILLAIYFACREKIKRCSLLDKMNIQDL